MNISNQTGVDTCTLILNYTGTYSYTGDPADIVAWMDGNWTTGADIDTSKTLYFNYSKPNSPDVIGGFLTTKKGTAGTIEHTDIGQCFNVYPNEVRFKGITTAIYGIYCNNGTSWIKLIDLNGVGSPSLYEESMTWNITLQLYSPINNSYDYFNYPDLTHNVYFSWTHIENYNYNIQIAKDENFNILTIDKIISLNYTTEPLESATYWWKVGTYDIGTRTYGNYSNVSRFYLIKNASSTGVTGIEGIVYTLVDSVPTPVSEATVYIHNEILNWSSSQITGSNGYYLFDNLTNATTYTIYTKAVGYEDGVIEYFKTVPGQITQKSLLLNKCTSGFNCFYNQQYVKFTVQNIWFTKYVGVIATVYKGSELTASDTKTTGTDGSVNFLLIKDQQYRITFINATQGISTTWIGYPSKTEYLIITDDTYTGWDTDGTDAATTTDIEVTTQTINNTHAYVNMSYNDTLAGTSNLKFYLNKSIAGDPNNQTNLQSIDGGDDDQYNASFMVSGYGGNSYIVRVRADHSTYGTISYSYGVQFAQIPGPLANFDPTIILMLFVAFILFISGVFGQTTNAMGSGIICGLVWILAGIGVFSSANVGTNFYLALTLATIIVIIMNINERGRHEALQ